MSQDGELASAPSVTPQSLLLLGRAFKKQGKLDEAIEYFARAVEQRMEQEESEVSAELGEYLMAYADALLLKEEANAADLMSGFTNGAGGDDSDGEEGTIPRLDSGRMDQPVETAEEENLSDLQLAWESFEHARLCLLCHPDDYPSKARDLSFVHCRLGDIQALQEQFPDSIADYGQSIEYAVVADESARKVAGLVVSLSQTLQTYMSSPEVASSSPDLTAVVSKLREIFTSVSSKYDATSFKQSAGQERSLAHLAKDGFLLAQALLATCPEASSSLEELTASAEDCLHQDQQIRQTVGVVHGVTVNGFAEGSNTPSGPVVTVAVKRKLVDEDTNNKKAKDDESQRASKAKLVD